MGQEARSRQGDDRERGELHASSPAATTTHGDRILGVLARDAVGPGRPAALARALAAGARLSNRAVARMLARQGYGYGYADDPLNSGGFGPSDATIRVKPGPVRTTLLRPRTESGAAAVDAPSQTPQADWDARFRAMSDKIEAASEVSSAAR